MSLAVSDVILPFQFAQVPSWITFQQRVYLRVSFYVTSMAFSHTSPCVAFVWVTFISIVSCAYCQFVAEISETRSCFM